MALLTAQQVVPAGMTPTYAAANATDTFPTGDSLFLHVKVGGTATTITVNSPSGTTCSLGIAGAAHNNVVGPLTSTERMIGPLTSARYNDPTTGLGSVTYSQVTGVTAALVQF